MANKNDNLVVSYFNSEAAAEEAAEYLKRWDKANDAVKLGAIAILTLPPNKNDLEVKEIGQRDTKKGALWGAAIGAAAAILSGGIALIPGLALGLVGGGTIGALNHKSLGMSDDDRESLVYNLRNGGAALAIMADDFEIVATKAELEHLGGTTSAYKVPENTAAILEETAEAQTRAVDTVDEAVAGAAEEVADITRSAGIELDGLPAEAAAAVGSLAAIGNLDAQDARKLFDAGIDKASTLLARGATPAGRAALAAATGLSPEAVMDMVKRTDLMRVPHVGVKHAGLLLAAGVDTVPELAQRNPANLVEKLGEVNALQSLVESLPSADEVTGWVSAAKALPKMITY